MLVPPVLVGGDHDKLMQSLKALTTFGAEGGPGYAVKQISKESILNIIYANVCELHAGGCTGYKTFYVGRS